MEIQSQENPMSAGLDLKSRYDTYGGILMFPNKYGYRVNITHPEILPLWKRFYRWKGIPIHFPMSDADRFEFESYIFKMLEKRKKAAESGDRAATEKEDAT
ncbi:MAG: hypothetical protein J1E06_05840 [Acutalibacter sp.]|nr:hypothetical protein [Acutalibacter sp.]